MADDRRRIAWTLSRAARLMPAAERQRFREFLNSLAGGEPAPRKIHRWHRKSKAKPSSVQKAHKSPRPTRRAIDRQIPLPLD